MAEFVSGDFRAADGIDRVRPLHQRDVQRLPLVADGLHGLTFLALEDIHRHGVRHRRLVSRRTAGARPHLQHRLRRLTRRSDIRDTVHKPFLTRRQQHRRPLDLGRLLPKERKNGQNKTFLFIILIELNCFLGLFPSSI